MSASDLGYAESEDWEWLAAHATKWLSDQRVREKRDRKSRARELQQLRVKAQSSGRHPTEGKKKQQRSGHESRCHIRSEANRRRDVLREEVRLHCVWEQEVVVGSQQDSGLENQGVPPTAAREEVQRPQEEVPLPAAENEVVADATQENVVVSSQEAQTEATTSGRPPPPSFAPPSQVEHQEELRDLSEWEETIGDSVRAILEGGTGKRKKQLLELDATGWERILQDRGYELPLAHLTKNLGKGSFGSVEKVHRTSDYKRFALKRQFLGDFADAACTVLREISILNVLKGAAHICQIEDAFLARPQLRDMASEIWIVLEHFPHSLCAQRFRFKDPENAKHAVFQLLRGLSALHSVHIIHRDLKPDNILVDLGTDFPNTLRLSICDFGHSRSVHNVPDATDNVPEGPPPMMPLTRDFSVMVTSCWWRAPEMWDWANTALMSRQHFLSLDVFAFGLIWAELLANENVIESTDSRDPDKLRLLEILQKVECPCAGQSEQLGFKSDVVDFIEWVINGDMEAISNVLQGPLWTGDRRQTRLMTMPYTGIRKWVMGKSRLVFANSPELGIIETSTRFNYNDRATVEDLLGHTYFDELTARKPIDTTWTPAEVPHFDDVRSALTAEKRRQTRARQGRATRDVAQTQRDTAESVGRVNTLVREQVWRANRGRG